jgi:hypothetical protein
MATRNNIRILAQCGDDELRTFDLSVIGPQSDFGRALEKGVTAFNLAFRESLNQAREERERQLISESEIAA